MEIQNNPNLQPAQLNQPKTVIHNNPATPHRVKKTIFDLARGDFAFIIGAIISCMFVSLYGLFDGFALGYSIAIIIFAAVFIFYLAKRGKSIAFSIASGVLTISSSAVFVCTSNSSVRFFGVIINFLLALACFGGFASGKIIGNRQTIGIFYSAASSFGNIGITFKSIFHSNKNGKKSLSKVLLGLACAMPVVFTVLPLLMSSDDAFRGMMNKIFDNTLSTLAKAIFGTMIAALVIPYGLSIKSNRVATIKKGKFKGIENVYITSFLSAIAVCYLLYLFSQLAYFFSAFKGFLPVANITYAEYARKGFFEMCIIAVINLAIVFTAWLLAKKKDGKISICIKILVSFITLFTLVIIATAISKMVLYINHYGMTVLRITTSAFMLFLTIVFISIILKIFIKKINFVKTALLAAGVIILLLGTINVNEICAKYNYDSFISGKLAKIDVNALYELGDEGIPYLVKLSKNNDTKISQQADNYLMEAFVFDYFENIETVGYITEKDLDRCRKHTGFYSYTIPREKAYEALYEYVEENPGFGYILQNRYTVNTSSDYDW